MVDGYCRAVLEMVMANLLAEYQVIVEEVLVLHGERC